MPSLKESPIDSVYRPGQGGPGMFRHQKALNMAP